ncbi:TIGR02996 domain-containing protein [Gemmata sp. G18]|uniref:TIGR02996 domain-containing protein n=1 Tax=Gemmata palustris TaxID=2822762 RepID=A0ABS5BJT6_9BACT|nr:TIGR02996 domain-containing protein [Gemmata palustris]MBP3953971.1 TIGR02996 domain-containing protein [Gemmata palustris]
MSAPIPDEQAALLAAIVAEPDEDTPRLVYADWLQENGDGGQAQFIRASIKLSLMSEGAEGWKELRARLLGLEGARGEAWIKKVGLKVAPLSWECAGFERGLLTKAAYRNVEDFVAEGRVLFARLPVCKLTISPEYFLLDGIQKLTAMPELARLCSLCFNGSHRVCLSLDDWEALIHSPHLSGLREFSATAIALEDEHLLALANCSNLTALTILDLSGNRMTTSDGQLAILRSPHLTGVKKLSLANGDTPENRELINLVVARFGSDAPLRKSVADQ